MAGRMRIGFLTTATLVCGAIGSAGCERVATEHPELSNRSMQAEEAKDSLEVEAKTNSSTENWVLYSPPERDFSVMAPEDSVEVTSKSTNVGKFREYVFKKGEAAPFSVNVHTERKGALAGNSVEDLKSDTSDYLPGSLRDISLNDMPGIEFRMSGAIGESVFQEFCAPDNSRSISIQVAKDVGEGLTEDEVRTFLDSFKLVD